MPLTKSAVLEVNFCSFLLQVTMIEVFCEENRQRVSVNLKDFATISEAKAVSVSSNGIDNTISLRTICFQLGLVKGLFNLSKTPALSMHLQFEF